MILQSSINEVMNRADIIDVVGQFVRLKKRGTNYIANCPFHNEKTPSFNVSQTKGIYKCFGCGKAGNVVTFLQEHEKLTYPEAIKWLADFYKITLEETERTPEQKQHQQEGEALRLLNEYAANFFHDVLINGEEGQLIGMSYFKQRGFRKETIEKFRLGYCPERGDAFFKAATGKGYSPELLEKAGLIKKWSGSHQDNYKGRVIFPFQNMTGRIIGFGARVLKSQEQPKYINTPENELYKKSETLYGIFQGRQSLAKQDECFLVEGYADVISLHQAGVEHTVASSGTSLTEEQLRVIGRLTKNLTILYDSDAAGKKAALRGMDMALSQSFNVRLVLLPEKEDPDSYVQKYGAAAFTGYVEQHRQDIISFRMLLGLEEAGDDPVKRSKLVNEIAETISRINKAEDFALQEHYIKLAANRLKVDQTGLINLVNKHIRDRVEAEGRNRRENVVLPEIQPDAVPEEANLAGDVLNEAQEWQLLRILIEYGHQPYEGYSSVAHMLQAKIDADLIEIPLIRKLYDEYFAHYFSFGAVPEIHFFMNYPEPLVRQKMATLLMSTPEISTRWKEKYGIERISGTLLYLNDLESSINYFEYKKLLQMQEKQLELLKTNSDPENIIKFQMGYLELRKMEKEMLLKHHTVVFKSLKFQLTGGKNNGA